MNKRWLLFLLCIAIGTGIGLVYGWIISPVEVVETAPNTLRLDFKTDYVLMVAEIFSNEQDLDAAVRRLARLGGENYPQTVRDSIVFAVSYAYAPVDLAHMQGLLNALEASTIVYDVQADGGV